jgi:carbon-monoxide dehydrogenase large subunit
VPDSLDVDHVVHDPVPSAFPNGCHIAEVELIVSAANVVRYTAVNDLGTIVNPLWLKANSRRCGAVVRQVLLEQAVYDLTANW